MKTDGGDCTITVASAINQTGNNTIAAERRRRHDRPGRPSKSAPNKAWRVVVNDGCTLSTV